MSELSILLGIDAVTVPVPDLDAGLAFYQGLLGHQLLWRNDDVGQAGLALVELGTEIVLTTTAPCAPTWLVSSVDRALDTIVKAGGRPSAASPTFRWDGWPLPRTPSATNWSFWTRPKAGT